MPESPAPHLHPLAVASFESIQRTREQNEGASARCKYLAVAITSTLLALLLAKQATTAVLWAVTPVSLLALLDAGFTARAKRQNILTKEFVNRLRNTPGKDGWEWTAVLGGDASRKSLTVALGTLRTLGSLSVWPFYISLVAGTVILGMSLSKIEVRTSANIRPPASNFPQSPTSRASTTPQPQFRPQQTGQQGLPPQAPGLRPQPANRPAQGPPLPPRPPLPSPPSQALPPTAPAGTPAPAPASTPAPQAPTPSANSTPATGTAPAK